MTTAQVVKTSVTNNSLSKGYPHPEDHDKPIRVDNIQHNKHLLSGITRNNLDMIQKVANVLGK